MLPKTVNRCGDHSFHFAGTNTGAPLSLTKNTTNFAGLALLAFRLTTETRRLSAGIQNLTTLFF
jgi:hypothetical protein